MKSVKINTLTLKNFKGIKNYTLDAGGDNLKIYGQNATGKSTLFDAFLWLLFDKDSQNQKNFAIKTIEGGKEIPMIDHEVEAELLIDGTKVALKKTYSEIWTKKRGSASTEFTGHESVFYIDEVPKKKNEYTKFIESIVEEEVFKLLTSPSYFNDSIKWQDRRNVLLRIAGEVSNDEIFKSEDRLKGLAVVMEGRKIEDFRLMQAAKKKQINDELEKIPVRVDEISLSLPEGAADLAGLEKEISETESKIDDLKNQISTIRSGGAILKKRGELQEAKNDQAELKRTLETDSRDEVYKMRAKLQEEESNLLNLQAQIKRKEDEIGRNDNWKAELKKEVEGLRDTVRALKKTEFAASSDCACPSCGQDLPEDRIQETNEKAEAAFNLQKSTELERLTTDGKAKVQKMDELSALNADISKDTARISDEVAANDKRLAKLKERLKTAEKDVTDASENPDFKNLESAIVNLGIDIAALEEGAEEAVAAIQDEISGLTEKRKELAAKHSKFANVPTLKARIAELQEREEVLAVEFEKIEEHIFLSDEFIRAKVRIMEARINEKFKFARFKLFKTNVNGGLEEMCETTFQGVEYSKGLNNAAKINVGLDIINTLSKFHALQAPIFVDNAEAVVNLIDVESQLISLVVSGSDKALRVEKKEGATA